MKIGSRRTGVTALVCLIHKKNIILMKECCNYRGIEFNDTNPSIRIVYWIE